MNALVPVERNADAYRASTDAAGLCREIVIKTAKAIQGRKYVCVEGWQAIAIAHGCTASADNVERVNDEGMSGFKALGIVRRMSDGAEIARAEGFVGDDEAMWAKRPVYARRAMVQTRAISRACRSAFAHVVVMIDAGLSTTPAEEVPFGGFDDGNTIDHPPAQGSPAPRTKLDGPHTSKTALKNAIHTIRSRVAEAKDNDAIDAVMREACETVKQAARDWPELLNGDPNIGEDIGLKGFVANRREAVRADDGELARLFAAMKQCTTTRELDGLIDARETYIETLSDEDRRRFDVEYSALESGLLQVAGLKAG